MGEQGGINSVVRAPGGDEGVKVIGLVELVVLQGVDNVEACHPEDDSEGEDKDG